MYENKMMGLKGQQLSASCNTPNLIAPGDDLGYRVEWKQPYVYGSADSKRTALSATAFNARKVSGVFIAGMHPAMTAVLVYHSHVCYLLVLCVFLSASTLCGKPSILGCSCIGFEGRVICHFLDEPLDRGIR